MIYVYDNQDFEVHPAPFGTYAATWIDHLGRSVVGYGQTAMQAEAHAKGNVACARCPGSLSANEARAMQERNQVPVCRSCRERRR